jgi:N6-adenosine-specific RNA methylase IME4
MAREKLYDSDAEKMRAYRARQKLKGGSVVRWLEGLISQGAKFGSVLVDPPWRYQDTNTTGAAEHHYQTMSIDEIAALPVSKLVLPNAHLHLWTTTNHIWDCPRIMDAWGFTPKSQAIWCKRWGCGHYWRVSHEILLLGVKGRATFRHHGLKSWFECARGEHSSKPDQVRHWIEQASPGPYLELFGRRHTPGWTVFGDTVEHNLFG